MADSTFLHFLPSGLDAALRRSLAGKEGGKSQPDTKRCINRSAQVAGGRTTPAARESSSEFAARPLAVIPDAIDGPHGRRQACSHFHRTSTIDRQLLVVGRRRASGIAVERRTAACHLSSPQELRDRRRQVRMRDPGRWPGYGDRRHRLAELVEHQGRDAAQTDRMLLVVNGESALPGQRDLLAQRRSATIVLAVIRRVPPSGKSLSHSSSVLARAGPCRRRSNGAGPANLASQKRARWSAFDLVDIHRFAVRDDQKLPDRPGTSTSVSRRPLTAGARWRSRVANPFPACYHAA